MLLTCNNFSQATLQDVAQHLHFASNRKGVTPHENKLEARPQMLHNLEHLKPFPSITASLTLLKLSYIFCEAKALHRQSVQNRRGQRQ